MRIIPVYSKRSAGHKDRACPLTPNNYPILSHRLERANMPLSRQTRLSAVIGISCIFFVAELSGKFPDL